MLRSVLLLFIGLACLSLRAQTKIVIGENGKKGSFQNYTNKQVLPTEFDELFALTKKGYDFGVIGKKDNVWSMYDSYGKKLADSLKIDDFVGNYYGDFCWVRKGNEIKKLSFISNNLESLKKDSINFKSGFGLIIKNHKEKFCYTDRNGKILIDFIYEQNWNHARNCQVRDTLVPLLFTNKAQTKSSFYNHNGSLINHFKGDILYLGTKNIPYLRVAKKGKTRYDNRDALAVLDRKSKKIKYLTGFDFWYFNEARGEVEKNGKTLKKVARASMPDKTEVFILEDGSTIEAPPIKY